MCKLLEEAMERNDEMTERRVADRRVVAASTDWRVYHSALSQCAEMLPNMKDGDPLTDAPKFLAAYLADRRVVAVAGSVDRNSVLEEAVMVCKTYPRANGTALADAIRDLKSAAPQQVDAVQAVPELVTQLREYASNPGYSHGDYADTMRQAADAIAAPSPAVPTEPSVKQLTAQLHDGQTWTITEQRAFAQVLAAFPNKSSQGIISLGDAWKHGQAYGEATVSKATRAVCAEASQKLRTYVNIYTGDKQARRLADELANIAVAQPTDTTAPQPVPKDAKLWADGIWRDSSGNELGPAA